jgi:membrane-associated phospholipid phosphatase
MWGLTVVRNGSGTRETRQFSGLLLRGILGVIIISSLCAQGGAQDFLTRGGAVPAGDDLCDAINLPPCFKRIAQDEVGMVASVFHIKRSSLPVILGVAAATGLALHYDSSLSKTFRDLPIHPNQVAKGADIAGVYAPFAVSGLFYLAGSGMHNSRLRETGILATEAMVDAALMGKALKYVVNRQPPGNYPQAQEFYATGPPHGGSMPSSHALNVWAFARVVAGESHSKWVGVGVYSLAAAVSFSRALTNAHSMSDVVVGSALGYGIGEYVLRRRSTDRSGTFHRDIPRHGDTAKNVERGDQLRTVPPAFVSSQANAQPVTQVAQLDTDPSDDFPQMDQPSANPVTQMTQQVDDSTVIDN